MTAPPNRLVILSSTATGMAVPYALIDLQQTLWEMGHRVLVQDNVAFGCTNAAVVAIADGLVSVEPDLFATIDHVAILPDVLAVLDRPPRVMSWFFDNPLRSVRDEFLSINSHYHIFSWDRAYLPPLREKGFRHLYYRPFATNPAVFHPENPTRYDYDVSFVGTFSPKRMEWLMQAADRGIRVDIFGDEPWRGVKHPRLIYHGAARNREDCPRIYSRSRINLNMTSDQLVTALPVRFFDVLACRGFLLTDYRADADELFAAGREFVLYSNMDDMAEKIRYFLDRESERNAIREAGYNRVLADYTFEKTVPDMIDTVLTAPIDLAANRSPPPHLWARGLWLTGVSYLKFGKYKQAYPRLIDALKLRPDGPEVLLAMALLANRIGQVSGVASCMDRLVAMDAAAWQGPARELLALTELGKKAAWWEMLYRLAYPKVTVHPADGTIPGWEPKELAYK